MTLWRWALVAATAVAGIVGGAGPSRSECLVVTVELHWWGDAPDTYPLGQRDTCVANTPWKQAQPVHVDWDSHGEEPPVPGMPQGFYVGADLALP